MGDRIMFSAKMMIQIELEQAKATLSKLEEIELSIMIYKEDLQLDIEKMEILIARSEDKKFSQINSALEFIQSDLQKYIKKSQPEEVTQVTQIESTIKATPTIKATASPVVKEKKINNGWTLKSDNILYDNGLVNNKLITDFIISIMIKEKNRIFKLGEITQIIKEKFPVLKEKWSNMTSGVSFIMTKALRAESITRVGKGEYQFHKIS